MFHRITKNKYSEQQLSTLSEGDLEPTEGTTDTNRISAIGNSSLPVQAGRNEILLGDQSLRQENRYMNTHIFWIQFWILEF